MTEDQHLLQPEGDTKTPHYNEDVTYEQEESEDQGVKKKQSIASATLNFLNSNIGTGILTIPFCFSRAGYAVGLVIILCFASLATCSYFILAKTANKSHKFQYDVVADTIFPKHKWVGYITIAAQMLFTAGCALSYVIVIKDNFFFYTEDQVLYISLTLAAIMFIVVLPLCFLPSLNFFRFNSFIVIIVVIYVDITLMYTFGTKYVVHQAPAPGFSAVISSISCLQAFPLITQSFSGQYNFLNIYSELANRKKNLKRIVFGNVCTLLVFLISYGFFGYLSYGSSTFSDILKNLAQESGKSVIAVLCKVANVGELLLMVSHYPLPVYSLRKSIESLVFVCTKKRATVLIQRILSTCIVVIATFTAMFLPSVDCVLDFTSSLAGSTLGFIMPGIYLWRMGYLSNNKKEKIWQICGGVAITVVGFIIAFIGFGMAIFQWIVCKLANLDACKIFN